MFSLNQLKERLPAVVFLLSVWRGHVSEAGCELREGSDSGCAESVV